MTLISTYISHHVGPIQKANPVFRSIHEILKDDRITYFHSHTATPKELEAASNKNVIFEIDLAWASTLFINNKNIRIGQPYIGHPEKFYTEMKKTFPDDNISLEQFKIFLKTNPSIKVLLDVKDEAVFVYLEEFIKEIGSHRCIVHAFIKDWTILPKNQAPEPHWVQEDIDLTKLDGILSQLNVPLIANCRGFSNEHVQENRLVQKIVDDGKKYKSIVCLGLYYPKAPIPEVSYLESINAAGFHVWINANDPQFQEKANNIRYIAMKDEI